MRKSIPMPIIRKLLKASDKKIKADQRNKTQYVQRNKDKFEPDFPSEKMKVRKQWSNRNAASLKQQKEKFNLEYLMIYL